MSARVAVEALDRLEQGLKDTHRNRTIVNKTGVSAEYLDGYADAVDHALYMVRDLLGDYDRPRGGAR